MAAAKKKASKKKATKKAAEPKAEEPRVREGIAPYKRRPPEPKVLLRKQARKEQG